VIRSPIFRVSHRFSVGGQYSTSYSPFAFFTVTALVLCSMVSTVALIVRVSPVRVFDT
jgi:hypothetical protein